MKDASRRGGRVTFTATLALYICTTAPYYITTDVEQCMAEQEQAAKNVIEVSSYAMYKASRKNWKGEFVGIDYVIVEKIMRE